MFISKQYYPSMNTHLTLDLSTEKAINKWLPHNTTTGAIINQKPTQTICNVSKHPNSC